MVLEYIVKLIFSREMKNRISVFLHLFSILVFRKYQWQSFLYTLQKFGLFFFSHCRQSNSERCNGRKSKKDAAEGRSERFKSLRAWFSIAGFAHGGRGPSAREWRSCRSRIRPALQSARKPGSVTYDHVKLNSANSLNNPRRSSDKISAFWDPQKKNQWSLLPFCSSELWDNH